MLDYQNGIPDIKFSAVLVALYLSEPSFPARSRSASADGRQRFSVPVPGGRFPGSFSFQTFKKVNNRTFCAPAVLG